MEGSITQSCPKCLESIKGTFLEHFKNECLQRSSVSKLSDKVAVFTDQTHICGRCLNSFAKDKWEYHQKKIRTVCTGYSESAIKLFTPIKSFVQVAEVASERDRLSTSQIRQFSQSKQRSAEKKQASSISQNRLYSTSFFSDRQTQSQRITLTKEITEDEAIVLILLNLLDARSKFPLLDWVKNNRKIKSLYLQDFFEKFLKTTFSRLRAVIKVPTFEMLEEKSALKWKTFLKQPEDIFSQDIILESVKQLSTSRKNKVLRCLNSIYNSFYEDVFPKFNIEAIEPQKKRLELPLRTKDFFKILEQLFASKERDLVHIGIDLYLIFQSAQRLVSDMENITKGVKQLLIDRKTDSKVCQLEMDIRKTRKSGKFILSEQICQLLEQFGWQGFYRNGKIYERMRKIFGFPVYSIKKCIFTQFELQKTKNQQVDIQKLANHGSLKVSLGYARDGVEINEKTIKDQLRIPNLRVCPISREVLYRFLVGRLRFRKHAKVYHDWLDRLKKKMHSYNKELCDFYDSDKQAIVDEDGKILFQESQEQINKEDEKQQDKNEQDQMKSLLEDVTEAELVDIFGISFSFKDKQFRFGELFTAEDTISYCIYCGLQFYDAEEPGVSCLVCNETYHSQCMPKFCFCILQSKFPVNKGVPFSSKMKSQLQLSMPEKYLNKKHQDKLDNIVFLLAARRFAYVPSPVLTEQVEIDEQMVQKQGAQHISLTHFEEYQKGNYFPPIFLDKSGTITNFGTGFGLFAAEDIQKDCFIGEYAADILNGRNMLKIKKYDSVMTLVEGSNHSSALMIGPRDYCGYVCLINGAKDQQSNCKSIKVEINGFLRIIVYTHKKIKQGEQLCYNYAESSIFSRQGLKKKSLKPKQQIITMPKQPLKVPLDFHRRGLKNLGFTCYMYQQCYVRNSVFQFLRIMIGDYLKEEDSSVQQDLMEINEELKKKEDAYDPQVQVNSILAKINASLLSTDDYFFINEQADAHEFLLQVLDKVKETSKTVEEMVTGEGSSTMICNKCKQESTTYSKFISLQKEMSQNRFQIYNRVTQDVDYKCQVCSHLKCTKTMSISSMPEVLILNLKRFTNSLTKISRSVKDFYTIKGYQLKAVIIHKGTTRQNGHYVTEEYLDDFVCLLDDSKVSYIEKDTSKSYGYIFGYRKINK